MAFYSKVPRLIRWVISYVLLLIVLMTAYRFFFFFHYRPEHRPFTGQTFLLGLRYDLRIVSVLAVVMLIIGSIPAMNPFHSKRAKKGWLIILSIVFLVVLVFYGSDFYHYDYLKQRLSASVLNFLVDAGISGEMMWQTYPVIKIILALIAAMVLFVWWAKRNFSRLEKKPAVAGKKRSKTIIYIVSFLLLGLAIFGKLSQYPLRWSDAFAVRDDFKANTALNPFQSFFSTLKFKNATYDIANVKKYYPLMADYLGVQQKDSLTLNYTRSFTFPDSLSPKPNVIIVICESFSAYKSSMFGNKLDPTPFFNTLCNEGAFFERCFTPAFGTARGVWATITGIPDVQRGSTASRNPLAVDQHTIINDFTGYDKFYFLGGSTTWANIRGLLTNNIDNLKIYEEEDFKAKKVDVWGISDKNLFLEASSILGQQKKPFISIIQTADNHRPYTIPAQDQAEFKKVEYPKDTLTKYGFDDNDQLNAFRYTDFCYRKFIEAAKKEPFFDNTIFVFVGDHGLRGDAGNMFPQSFTKQGILAEHVPLLFYAPKLIQPKRVTDVASQLDILPSVATIAKQSYTNSAFGRNLFDTVPGVHYAFIADPDIMNMGLVSNDYYYTKNLKTGITEFVSVRNNLPVNDDSARKHMAQLTEAWYLTAQYQLLNNKKKK
ncbi:LTA synthase family protein [Ferruginibacter sp. HRS2-29]|uniref:LTA synthase family protein n=1 Tax=Ferruginibacter sp. HRS2-29 TaxID=2487334 RepID=UPI0020CC60E7|nr:LTA synthase family protein [Ferruginibacter sp. HRS2-29]MCP9753289.1 LTA synthase family protein [Ferruginibacter sp. HRS2-29]